MKPTFLRVGVPKNTVRPPTTVKPPTEATAPSLKSTVAATHGALGAPSSTFTVTMPSAADGDRIWLWLGAQNGAVTSVPTGFTLEQFVNGASGKPDSYLYYLDVSGSAPSSVDFDSDGGQWRSIATSIASPGVATVATAFTSANATSHDPPAVTPTSAPGDHLILCFHHYSNDDGGGGADPGTSTGYSKVIQLGAGTAVPHVYLQQNRVAVVTSENPDAFTHGGGVGNHINIVTLAHSTPAAVAAADHTHTEADVTDLTHTDADAIHDNVASEISAITAKGTPTTSDFLLIEDAADSNNKKSITIGDLPGVTDHGALTGLADDDHTQYAKADGTRAFTGTVSGITPTADAHLATKGYVDSVAGLGELLMQDGVTNPPVPIETEAQDDWLYEDGSGAGTGATSTAFSGALVYRFSGTNTQNVASGTYVAVAFDSETYDTDSYADLGTNNTRLTAPTDGIYRLYGDIRISGEATFDSSSGNFRAFRFRKNGTDYLWHGQFARAFDALSQGFSINADVQLTAGDYIELTIYQNSGETLVVPGGTDNYSWFGIERLRDDS